MNCQEDISGPKELVRYFGANVHRGDYIKEVFENEKYWSKPVIKKYFQRIVNVTSSVSGRTE